ncbi:MAG TPA: hypothetical protein VFN22_11185 [Gemmatimonadales bacterium]|nr:hypothetical protein [Gemmatimonadales bacterium]
MPTADGRRLKPLKASEKTLRLEGTDSVLVAEAEFEIDTVRVKGERYWVATKVVTDSAHRQVIDSIWLERYELRSVRSFHQAADGSQIRQVFDRRVVKTETRDPDGRVKKQSLMHTAVPYSRTGVDLVLGALRWGPGVKGALPVVSRDGRDLAWLEYEVVGQTSEAKPAIGGLTFGNVWIVKTRLDGREGRIWIDDVDHTVIRRSEVRPDGSRLVMAMGAAVPRVSLFAVEPLQRDRAPSLGGAPLGGRVLGGGKTLGSTGPTAATTGP